MTDNSGWKQSVVDGIARAISLKPLFAFGINFYNSHITPCNFAPHLYNVYGLANLKQTWLNTLIKHSRQQIGMHAGGMIRSHFMGHSPIFFAQSNGILRFGYRSTCILMFFKLKGCILLVLHVHLWSSKKCTIWLQIQRRLWWDERWWL